MASDRVLIVEDESALRAALRRILEACGYDVEEAERCGAAEVAVRRDAPDVAVLDYELPDGNALTLLPALRALDPDLPVLVLTGHGSIDLAVRAMQEGADHFLTKPVPSETLRVVVARLLEQRRSRRKEIARDAERQRRDFDPFASSNTAVRRLEQGARRVAGADSAVLIRGETGTGKGVLARWLHEHGPRAAAPFVAINCAGLTRELLESELFGHAKGAFTGATGTKVGLLEVAQHGTVFLDEIGDIDAAVQPKLLKALDEKQIRRLGDVEDRPVDIRLIAATHHDLQALVREKRFRSDLYFRICTVPLVVPPLRERAEDIPRLVDQILGSLAADVGRPAVRVSPRALHVLQAYTWPGNIRELRNVLERAMLLAESELVGPEDLNFDMAAPPAAGYESPSGVELPTLKELERRHIEHVLKLERGRVAEAAKRLGIPRSSLYQKIKEYGIVVSKV